MIDFEIIPSQIEHMDGIMEVEHLCFTIPWSRQSILDEITKNKFAVYLSAKSGDKIIGYAGMWKVCGEGHITNIAVHPDYRGNGIGSALLERLIALAEAEDILRLTLEVRIGNAAARSLYKKYGFIPAGVRKAYYADNGEDAIIMWKDSTDNR